MAANDRANLRSVYLYLICLVTLVMSIFAAVSVVRNAVQLAYPDPGYYGYVAEPYGPGGESAKIDEEERERQEDLARESQRRQAILEIVGSSAMLLIAGPVYLYHWRRVQSEHTASRAVET